MLKRGLGLDFGLIEMNEEGWLADGSGGKARLSLHIIYT